MYWNCFVYDFFSALVDSYTQIVPFSRYLIPSVLFTVYNINYNILGILPSNIPKNIFDLFDQENVSHDLGLLFLKCIPCL